MSLPNIYIRTVHCGSI